MPSSKKETQVLNEAIADWQERGLLSAEQAKALREDLHDHASPRQQLAYYFVLIAVSAALLACGALLLDDKILERLRRAFLLSNWSIGLAAALLAVLFYWLAARRRPRVQAAAYELSLLPAALATAVALTYLCRSLQIGYTGLAAACLLTYALISLRYRSRLLWVCALLALVCWVGAFTTAYSTNGYFLGMAYPARFTLLGALLMVAARAGGRIHRMTHVRGITWHAGIILCFSGLWGLSVFGNFGSLDAWYAVRQSAMLPYAIITGLALGGLLLAGIRLEDGPLRDYALAFLLLHLYTRYFEYFWDALNKGLFFLVLAASFGLLAWLLSRSRRGTSRGAEG